MRFRRLNGCQAVVHVSDTVQTIEYALGDVVHVEPPLARMKVVKTNFKRRTKRLAGQGSPGVTSYAPSVSHGPRRTKRDRSAWHYEAVFWTLMADHFFISRYSISRMSLAGMMVMSAS